MEGDPRRPTWAVGRPLALAVGTVLALLGLLAAWAAQARIEGAVLGTGVIEVSTTRTAVQHPLGGVVVEILRGEGDRVAAGEAILRLDDRGLRAQREVNEGALLETLAAIARLEAALEGRPRLEPHPLLAEAAARDAAVRTLLDRQQRQLDDHFTALDTGARLIDEQVAQAEAQIAGVEAELAAKRDERASFADELARARELEGQGLIRAAEVTQLERSEVAARGEAGRLEAQVAELRGRIAELEVGRLTLVTDARERIGTELGRLRPEATRLLEERGVILGDLSRLEIRAPVSGRIIDSQVMGEGSVAVAASPLMMIVPVDEPVLARLRVAATDIDQVHPGQEASLKFKAFNGRQIPIVLGRVTQVSADASLDPTTRSGYYEVTVVIDEAEFARLGERTLIPGMPVEAFLATESRTPLSYLMRPILFYFDRAFRDA